MSKHSGSQRTEKNGNKMATTYSKSDERYWINRVEFWQRKVGGKVVKDKSYSVRLSHDKKREVFQLHTANKKVAGQRARDIFLSLKANGWDTTLDEFKPKVAEMIASPTIKDVIEVFLAHTKIATSSANGYVSCLRTVVAGVMKISKDNSRFSASTGGTDKWHEQVDGVKLSSITGASVDKWMKEFVEDRTEADFNKERSSRISVNTFLTGCRSIFGKKVIGAMREHLELPESIPFDEASKFSTGKKRYESKIKIEELISKAYRELRGIDQDQQWLTFLLSVAVGLRREETDLLIWDQIDFKERKIDLTGTKYFKPKGTLGKVAIDPELAGAIAEYQKESDSEFVIQSDIAPKFNTKHRFYRTNAHQNKLLAWLRANGFKDAKKPMHDLRKEAGSRIYEKYGLMAASKFMRHADVSTTADYYVDNSKDADTGFGSLLTGKESK
jgi:integrase